MKFAVFTALVATVASKDVECNPGKMTFELFQDKACSKPKFDKAYTPAKEDYHYFEAGCQHQSDTKWGWEFMCSPKGMHQTVWDNQKCAGKPVADLKYPWG